MMGEWQPGCTCKDCWYFEPMVEWYEPTEVGYPDMLCAEPPTCTGWAVTDIEGRRYVHDVPEDGHCHRWEPKYQVKQLLKGWDC